MRSQPLSRGLGILLAGTLALVASCGGSSDPAELVSSGEKELGTREFSAAAEHFDAALAAIGEDTSNPLYLRAKLGHIEARSQSDAVAAKDDLIALSRAMPEKITDRDFNRIASRMGGTEAGQVLEEAKKLYPDSEHLDKLGARLAEEAASSGNSELLEALAGMGYVGDS